MTMLQTTHPHRKALAVLAFCALSSLSLNASAQAIDSGTLTVKGSVQISTCRVNFRKLGSAAFEDNPVLDLGTITVGDFLKAGDTDGNPKEVGATESQVMVVSLSPTNSKEGNCTLGGLGRWDLQITSASTGEGSLSSYLKSPTGTSALVGIKSAVMDKKADLTATFSSANYLDLSNKGINVASGTTEKAAEAANGIAIRATFLSFSKLEGPLPGLFNSPITLTAVYQ